MAYRWLFALAVLLVLSRASPSLAQAVPCDVKPQQPECIENEKPREPETGFVIDIKPVIKLLRPVTVQPKTKAPQKPKKTAVVVKPKSKKTEAKAKPVTAKQVTSKKPPAALKKSKPAIPGPSWLGLPQTAVPVLAGSDFDDIPGQFTVELNRAAFQAQGLDLETITLQALADLLGLQPAQIRSVQRVFMGTAVLRASPDQAQALARNPLVLKVHADTKIKAMGGDGKKTPPLSWGLDRLDVPVLPLDGKFDRDSGSYEARLYVFDTGIDSSQPEFGGRVKWGAKFAATVKKDARNCRNHGTEMASLAGGANTGSAPKVEIIDVVVLPCSRESPGEGSSLIEAAEWVLLRERELKESKPVVVNMSLAGKWSEIINRSVEVLTKNNVAVVVAAGNNGLDACRFSPASAPDAVTVGATNAKDGIAGFSNYGPCLDLHAPGDLVTAVSEGVDAPYVAVRGTSGASALVAGLLARSIRQKGPKAAADWLDEAGVPQDLWLKSKPKGKPAKLVLAQMSANWRKTCRINLDGLSLRQRPADHADIILTLTKDTRVVIESTANGWVRVVADDKRGWIKGEINSTATLAALSDNAKCDAVP